MSVDLTNARKSEVGAEGPTEASKKVVDSIVDDVLGLPESNNKKKEEKKEKESADDKPDLTEADEQADTAEEDGEQPESEGEDEGEPAEGESEEKTDEDLIPKSKVQERIDSLTAKIKTLQSENAKLSNKPPQTQEEKLEKLSIQDLKSLKRQTKLAQRAEKDDSRYVQLVDLEEKVDEMITNYPARFQQKQLSNLNSILPEVAKVDPLVLQGKGDLWNTAASIYQRSQALQSSEMGQVEAMMLAAEHIALKKSTDSGRQKVADLNQQVTTLKKKTSLEGKTRVSTERSNNIAKLREKARTGDIVDKENFFREALVPDEFLQI